MLPASDLTEILTNLAALKEGKRARKAGRQKGVRVLTANVDDLTDTSDPSRIMTRQIAGAFSEFERRRMVHRLKVARDRKKRLTGKGIGRKTLAEARPESVALAKQLHAQGLSLRRISTELASRGHVASNGKPYVASHVQQVLKREGSA
jgi:DNA invertase Pin-like site-specific DNA recombinase